MTHAQSHTTDQFDETLAAGNHGVANAAVDLKLYDTATHAVSRFEPIKPGEVGMYVCGATVQSAPHIDNGHAYVIRDEHGELTGDVYFDVASWPHYGELTHQKQTAEVDEAAAVADRMGPSVDASGDDKYNPADPADLSENKRDPRDFALWKRPKSTDPADARWKTPFGTGRPGWHIECSAMSYRYLDGMFDIHGGGLDLRFPHHENEMAQTRAAGYRTANRWMHSAWVTAKGEKMSKSLGNGLSVPVVLAEHSAWVVRYALGSVQYRSMLEWSDQTLAEAEAAYERIMNFIGHAADALGEQPSRDEITGVSADNLPVDFVAAMNDDVNVSRATAAIFTQIREGNTLLARLAGNADDADRTALRAALVNVRAMLDTLGLDPLASPWIDGGDEAGGDSSALKTLGELVDAQLAARAEARKNKDFAKADQIRDALAAAGITIEDGPTGSTWTLAPSR